MRPVLLTLIIAVPSNASKGYIAEIPPPISINVVRLSVKPSGAIHTGDEVVVECVVEAQASLQGVLTQLGLVQGLADETTLKMWMVGPDGKIAEPSIGGTAHQLEEMHPGQPVTFGISFRAKACGHQQVYFSYRYRFFRKTACAFDIVFSRCIQSSPEPLKTSIAPPSTMLPVPVPELVPATGPRMIYRTGVELQRATSASDVEAEAQPVEPEPAEPDSCVCGSRR